MSNECIPLAKGDNASKRTYPGFLSVKLDGVPVRLDLSYSVRGLNYAVRTRQGEQVVSVLPAVRSFMQGLLGAELLPETGGQYTFVFEVTDEKLRAFKDVSGKVRKQSEQQGLILNTFIAHSHQMPDSTFSDGVAAMRGIHQSIYHESIKQVYQYPVANDTEFEYVKQKLLLLYPTCEGLVYRAGSAMWKPGTRHWDYQKIVNDPTADVQVLGFEEAVCGKTGAGKGMVGRINIRWKDGNTHGVGPGKLTHTDRKALWAKHGPYALAYQPPICTIKYKRDDTYEGPRQGTFQHWRTDKTEPSYE